MLYENINIYNLCTESEIIITMKLIWIIFSTAPKTYV